MICSVSGWHAVRWQAWTRDRRLALYFFLVADCRVVFMGLHAPAPSVHELTHALLACVLLQFEVPYDILVCAHGEQPATFGVKGVEEYAFFMKEVSRLL